MIEQPLTRTISAAAWAGILCLVVLTLVPASERPNTGLEHGFEHALAFGTVGILAGLAFRTRLVTLFAAAMAFTACLELLQIFLPTRHARLEDFLTDTLGAWLGLAACYVLYAFRIRRRSV